MKSRARSMFIANRIIMNMLFFIMLARLASEPNLN